MPAEVPMPALARPGARAWPWVLGGAACLMLPAAVNGVPFTYYDTITYITRPDAVLRLLQRVVGMEAELQAPVAVELEGLPPEDMPLAHRGRSMFYRMFGWAGAEFGGLWPVAVVQALAVSATLMILWRRALGWCPGPRFLLAVGALALLTPLGYFTGLVMPDALAGLTVLAVALMLVLRSRLRAGEQLWLGFLILYGMLSHSTHVLIGAGMLALALLLWRPLRRAGDAGEGGQRGVPGAGGAVVVGGAVIVALALELLVIEVFNRHARSPMVTMPHITSGLVNPGGPGTDFLRRNCPEAGFVLCDYVDRLPMDWIDFLFNERDPERGIYGAVPPAVARAIAAEQVPFLLAVIRDDPLAMLRYAGDQTLAQLFRFGMDDAMIPPASFPEFAEFLSPEMAARIEASVLHRAPEWLDVLSVITYATMTVALGGLALAGWRLARAPPAPADRPILLLALALLAGVVLNAAVCGILAAPYDRFQARVIWLLPLAALMLLTLSRSPAPRQEADP